MFTKSKFILPVLAGLFAFQACDKGGSFKKSESGLEYKLFSQTKDGKYEAKEFPNLKDSTKLNKEGQIVRLHMKYITAKDSVLLDSREKGMPFWIPVMKPSFKGGLEEAFAALTPGDSGVFKVNADSLFAKTFQQPLPKFIEKGSTLTFFIKSEKVMSQQEAMMDQQTSMMAFMEKQNKTDDAVIQKYIKDKGLQPQKTNSGLYYVVTQEGNGTKAEPGKMVAVNYTGTTLDGKEFDSSKKQGKPIEFPLGQGAVIRGWDEGIALLNKGSKATFLIPSTMAYGPQESPEIPANSVLRFDVELVDVKDMPAQQAPQFPVQPQ
ncbi:MAG: FKBP-type peptidyl-prolyl cis-trans isomerase [Adhaeribacter sp.]